jgi:hypothetical protein
MNKILIEKAKQLFLANLDDFKTDPWDLRVHLQELVKWAMKILNQYPEADKDVIMLTVWLHDIGHYPIPDGDHAVVSESAARKFLSTEKVNTELAENVLHCIRSHRNSDVKPESFEAKLFAMIDSASHFTYLPYIRMTREGRSKDAMEKLERDYRDLEPFPKIKTEITPIYTELKRLLNELKKILIS